MGLMVTQGNSRSRIIFGLAIFFSLIGLGLTAPAVYAQDPTVTKTVDPAGNVRPGDTITYTISFTNSGGTATGVVITDTVPVTLTGVTVVSSGLAITDTGAAQDYVWDVEDMVAGDSGVITLTGIVDSSLTISTTFTNTVEITSTTSSDTDTSNNSATVSTTVWMPTDLLVTKSAPEYGGVGSPLTYTITVRNQGPFTATNVTLVDTLPSGVISSASSIATSLGSCSLTAGVVSCDLGTLASPEILVSNFSGNNIQRFSMIDGSSLGTFATFTGSVMDTIFGPDGNLYVSHWGNNSVQRFDGVNGNFIDEFIPAGVVAAPIGLVFGPDGNLYVANRDTDQVFYFDGQTGALLGRFALTGDQPHDIIYGPDDKFYVAVSGGDRISRYNIDGSLDVTFASGQVQVRGLVFGDDGNLYATIRGSDRIRRSISTTVNSMADYITTDGQPSDADFGGDGYLYVSSLATDSIKRYNGTTFVDTFITGLSDPSYFTFSTNEEVQAVITIVVTPTTASTLVNNATVSSDNIENDATDNTASTSTIVNDSANLSITKSDSSDPVIAGDTVTYTLTIDNNGPDAASNVVITDTLPTGLTLAGISSSTGTTCEELSGVITCTAPLINDAGQITVSLETIVSAVFSGTLTNPAGVTSEVPDSTPGNNTTTEATTVNAEADLIVQKVDSTDPVIAGNSFSYSLVIINSGPASAENVVLTDTLPTSTTFVAATTSLGSCSETNGEVTCNFGDMSLVPLVESSFDSDDDGWTVINNGVAVLHTTSGGNPSGYIYTVDNTANAFFFDAPAKFLGDQSAVYGGTLKFDLKGLYKSAFVTSQGELFLRSPAFDLRFYLNPPDGATTDLSSTDWQSWSITLDETDSRWRIDAAPYNQPTSEEFQQVLANLTGLEIRGDLGAGDNGDVGYLDNVALYAGPARVTITVTAESAITPNTTIVNTAVGDSDTTDPTLANNTDTENTLIIGQVDLALSKSESNDPVTAGDTLTYTLNISNIGPSAAYDVVVTDTLPLSVTVSLSQTSQGSGCTGPTAGVLSCDLGTVLSGTSNTAVITLAVLVDPAASGLLTNTAGVTMSTIQTDTDTTNNSLTTPVTTTIDTAADLTVTKLDDPDPVVIGRALTYTVSLTNNGPSDALNVILTDTFTGVSFNFNSSSTTQGSCSGTNPVVCDVGAMTAGQQVTVTLRVTPTAAGDLTNSAEISSATTPDPTTANNTVTETTTVGAPVLVLSKTVNDLTPVVGDRITYTILVANTGTADATTAQLTDTLPSGVTFAGPVILDPGQSTATLAITAGDLPDLATGLTITAGEQITLTLPVTVDATLNDGAELTNTAAITSTELTTAVSDTATITIVNQVDLAISKAVDPTVAPPGGAVTYTLSFTNNGPGSATTIVITDQIPISVTAASLNFSSSGVTITDTGATSDYVWQVADMAAGESGVITITGTLSNPLAEGSFLNTAEISSTIFDSATANNTAQVSLLVSGSPQLTLTKTVDPETSATYQGPVTYTVIVTNSGAIDAVGLLLTDTLPAEVDFDSWLVQNGAIEASDVITWSGDLTANTSLTFQFIVSHTGNFGDVVVNTADIDYTGNISSASGTFTVTQQPTANPDTYTVAEGGTLVITASGVLTNDTDPDGDSLTAQVVVSPTYASSFAFSSGGFTYIPIANFTGSDVFTYTASDGRGGVATTTVTINVTPVNDAPIAGSNTILYEGALGTLPTTQGITYTNVDAVSPFVPESPQVYDTDGARVNSTADADDYAGYTSAGAVLDRNTGYTVKFSAQLFSETHLNNDRAGFSVIAVSSDGVNAIELGFWTNEIWAQEGGTSPDLFTHAEGATFDTTTGLIPYELTVLQNLYSLRANGTEILSGTMRDYTAFVGFIDPYETPNFLFFGDDTTSASADFKISYISVITNSTPPDYTTASDTELLIPTVGLMDFDAGGNDVVVTVTVNSGVLTVTNTAGLSAISGNGSNTVVLTGTVDQINHSLLLTPSLTYRSNVGFAGVDVATVTINDLGSTGGGNLTDTATFNITVQAPLLSLGKTVDNASPQPASGITYTLVMTNSGLVDASNITLSDTLATGLTFAGPVTLEPAQAGATLATAAGDLPNLATGLTITAGEQITLTFPVTVDGTTNDGDILTNTATVTGSSVTTTISDTATVVVSNQVDVAINKSVTPSGSQLSGTQITYTLSFTNNGPGVARNVVITDIVPLTLTNVTSDQVSGVAATPTSNGWQVGDMVAGASGVLTIAGQIDPTSFGGFSFTNTAEISTSTSDTDASNDSSQISVTVAISPGAVLINEAVVDPQQDWSANGFNGGAGAGASGTDDEWVELYIVAPGLDLTGWTIELNDGSDVSGDLTTTGAFDTVNYVPTGGGSFNNTATGDYVVLGNVDGAGSMNNSITIVLKDPTGAIIDQVQIGSGGAPDGVNDGNATSVDDEAIARVPNGTDTDNDVTDFVQQKATLGSTNNISNLRLSKTAVPTYSVAFNGQVTYTITLSNIGSTDATGALFTDTLPTEVDFASWLIEPSGANVTSDELTWNGTITAGETITFSFIVTYTNNTLGDIVTNTAQLSHTSTVDLITDTAVFVAETQILINEIYADDNDDANNDGSTAAQTDEFIEFVNNTGAPLDISGWRVSDDWGATSQHTFASGTIIPAGCAAVVFGGGNPTGSFGGSTVQTATNTTLDLTNTGDSVVLLNGSYVMAAYSYGAEANNNQSITRNPDITGPEPLVQHTTTTGGLIYSPGTQTNGESFVGCNAPPDLTLTKTVNQVTEVTDVTNQSPVTYTLVLSNGGLGNAIGLLLTDSLSLSTTFSNWITQPTGAVDTASQITWSGNLSANSQLTFGFVVSHTGDYADVVTNTGIFSYAGVVTRSNTTTFTVEAAPQADVQIIKSADPTAVEPGGQLTYTLSFSNAGPDVASTVRLTDVIPVTLTNLSVISSGPGAITQNIAGQTYSWQVGDLTAGQSGAITLTGQVVTGLTSESRFTNTAEITTTTQDTLATNDTSSVGVDIRLPVLEIAKQSVFTSAALQPSGRLTYTIVVTNNGSIAASNVTITDSRPVSTSYLAGTIQGGDSRDDTTLPVLSWTINSLAVGVPQTVTFAVQVNSASVVSGSEIVNTAWATSTGSPTAVSDTITDTVVALPILEISKQAIDSTGGNLEPGDILTYTLQVTNSGNIAATTVQLSDTVPADTTYIGGSIAGGDTPDESNAPQLAWTINNLAVGGTAQLTFAVTVNHVYSGTVITNTATVTSSELTTPVSDTISHTVTAFINLELSKSVDNPTPNAGETVTFTVIVSNSSLITANNVVVSDTLPSGLTYLTDTPSQGIYGGGTLWTVGTISPSTEVTLTVVATATSTAINAAEVESVAVGQTDLNSVPGDGTGDDYDSVTVTPVLPALSFSKSVTPTTNVPYRGRVTYTLVISNSGAGDALNTLLTDTLPISTTFNQFITPPANATQAGNQVTWNGTVTSNEAITLTFEADHSGGYGDVVTNSALIFHNSTLTVSNLAVFTVSDIITLTIAKTSSLTGTTLLPTMELTYTIVVTNSGSTAAQNVTLSDTLPADTSYVVGSIQGGDSQTVSLPNLAWTINSLAVNVPQTMTFRAMVNSSAVSGTAIVNTVSVTSAEVTTALSDTVTDTVIFPVADIEVAKLRLGAGDVLAGDAITYTIAVTNNGPDGVNQILVTDTFTGTVTGVSTTGSCSGTGPVLCSLTNLAAGSSEVITLVLTTDSLFSGTLTNTVAITFASGTYATDSTPGDTTDQVVTTVRLRQAELQIGKARVGSGDVIAGQPITYLLTVINNGPDTPSSVVVTDTFTGTATIASSLIGSTGGACTHSAPTVVCPLTNLTGTELITIVLTTGSFSGTLTNTAALDFAAGVIAADPDGSNNQTPAVVDTVRFPESDLQITKVRTSAAQIFPGEAITYVLTAINNGPDITSVRITDTYTGTVSSIISSTTGGATCTLANPLICNFTSLTGTETITLVMNTPTSFSGIFSNSAAIGFPPAYTAADPTSGNNQSAVVTATVAGADIVVSKSVNNSVPFGNSTIIYTLQAVNNGPDAAIGLLITDTLPTGLTFVSATGDGTYNDGTGQWTIGSLASGNTAQIQLTAQVDAVSAGSSIVNTAQRQTSTPDDFNTLNDTGVVTVNVQLPQVSFQSGGYSIGEAGGAINLIVTLNTTTTANVTVDVTVTGGTATNGADYTVTTGTLTIPAGSLTATLVVTSLDDLIYEGNETVAFGLSNVSANAQIGSAAATLTIIENEVAPNNPPVANNEAYTTTAGLPLTVPASGILANDSDPEGSALTAILVLGPSSGSLTLNPNGAFSYTPTAGFVGSVTFQYQANDGAVNSNLATVTINVTNDPPVANDDTYSTLTSLPLTVLTPTGVLANDSDPDGHSLTAALLVGPTNGSLTLNPDGSFTYTPNPGFVGTEVYTYTANDGYGGVTSATVRITVDNFPGVRFNPASYTVNEGAGQATISVRLDTASPLTATVDYQSTDGTALFGTDYLAVTGRLTFAPGSTLQTVTVPILDDTLTEASESFTLRLLNPVNAIITGTNPASVTITDNEVPPVVNLESTLHNVAEDGGSLLITVTLNATSSQLITVAYSIVDGTATAGSDYVGMSGVLTFTPGITQLTISLNILSDTLTEGNETFFLSLVEAGNATLGGSNQATVTILEAGALSLVQFVSPAYSVNEGAGQATIAVSLNSAVTETVSVGYTMFNGTALAGEDYVAVSGVVNFAPGSTLQTFLVPITDDLLVEPDETITLTLRNPVNAELGSPITAGLTIIDDDTLPITVPITGLLAFNDSPHQLGQVTTLSATVISGTNISYSWALGDGTLASGQTVVHTYLLPGVYTAVVTASNASSLLTATTTVTITAVPTVTTEADLTIQKVVAPNPAVVNQRLTYTLIITNHGPDVATNIVLTDSLPVGMVPDWSSLANCSNLPADQGGLICQLGSLISGTTTTMTIAVTPTATGQFTNTAGVSANQRDPVARNNVTSATHFVGDALTTLLPNISSTLIFTDDRGNQLLLTVPPGVVTEPIVLVLTELPGVDTIPRDFMFADYAFKLEFYQGGRLLTNYEVNDPMAMTIELDNSLAKDEVVLMVWDGLSWVEATTTCSPPTTPNRQANQLTLTICQAPGQFALFKRPGETQLYLPIILNRPPPTKDSLLYLPIILRQPTPPLPTPTSTPLTPVPTATPTPQSLPDLRGSFRLTPNQTEFFNQQPVTITVTITNDGPVASGPFWVDLYINPRVPPTSGEQLWNDLCELLTCYGLAWRVIDGLGPGESITLTSTPDSLSVNHSRWLGFFANGTTDLYLYVDTWNSDRDPAGAVAESNEANNRAELHGLTVVNGGTDIPVPAPRTGFPPRSLDD